MKVAVVGVGGMGKVHVKAYKRMEDVEIVALCDVRTEMTDKLCEELGVKQYTDLHQMLEEEALDILDICTPSYLHKEMAIEAMQKGIHVVVEKPIALKEADAKEVYEIAEAQGVKFMVAQVLRFWPDYKMLKDIYDSKKYGQLLDARFYRIGSYPKWSWDNWMLEEERSGLVPFDLHIHDLDFIVYMLGEPTETRIERTLNEETHYPDHLMITYKYGDVVIQTEAAWYAMNYPFTAGYFVQFEEAIVEYNGKEIMIYTGEEKPQVITNASDIQTGINLPDTDAYYNELRYFVDKVKADEKIDSMTKQELCTVLNVLERL